MNKNVLLTQEEFIKRLKDENILYKPLEKYKGNDKKIKWLCYKDSRHIFECRPNHMWEHKSGCPYCSNMKILIGYNDMWTINPKMASMLENPEDGHRYVERSGKKTNFICPDCGRLHENRIIYDVYKNGLRCKCLKDGMSFGERFIYWLLMQYEIDFVYDRAVEWSECRRYDFRIPSMSLIIEVHGIQHYRQGFNINTDKKIRTLQEEIDNDVYKKKLAISNNIEHYIELDCRYSDFEYVKNSLLNSELQKLFDFSIVDWNLIFNKCSSSRAKDAVELWNSGVENIVEISKILGIDRHTVLKYIKNASSNNLCEYNAEKQKELARTKAGNSQSKTVICLENLKVFQSITEASKSGDFTRQGISACCRCEQEKHKGYHWMFYEDYLKAN